MIAENEERKLRCGKIGLVFPFSFSQGLVSINYDIPLFQPCLIELNKEGPFTEPQRECVLKGCQVSYI